MQQVCFCVHFFAFTARLRRENTYFYVLWRVLVAEKLYILQEQRKYLSLVKSNLSGLLLMLRSDWLSYY